MRCLVLHGLGGSPADVAPVAEALERAGFACLCPLLPGHGESEAAYLASSYGQWLECAQAAYVGLRARETVLLAGYSLGGLLALELAVSAAQGRLPQPAGVLALAVPLYFWHWRPWFCADWRCLLLPLWSRLQPVRRVRPRSQAAREAAPWQGHETVCSYRHLDQMARAQARVRAGLAGVRVPVCAVQLVGDKVCHPYNAWHLAQACGAADSRLHLLRVRGPHGGHLPVTNRESRARVAALAAAFAREVADGKACKIAVQRI
ncbi:MAG: alpha/beta fold hydrolase [Desulfovibrio desulfuricans]|nr:alpha/beta fold hydrolase [Desulfovibrio desulfuricans]